MPRTSHGVRRAPKFRIFYDVASASKQGMMEDNMLHFSGESKDWIRFKQEIQSRADIVLATTSKAWEGMAKGL